MALYLPIRVQDQGEGQSEEDRIAKLKEYIQEVSSDKDCKSSQAVRASRLTPSAPLLSLQEHQPHKVELSGEGEVALVRERGEAFFYSLLYNCGVTCAFYENDQPRVLIYGQKVSKRMAEHALRMWLSDPEQVSAEIPTFSLDFQELVHHRQFSTSVPVKDVCSPLQLSARSMVPRVHVRPCQHSALT